MVVIHSIREFERIYVGDTTRLERTLTASRGATSPTGRSAE